VATSFGEVQDVLDGKVSAQDARDQGYAALDTVPAWDDSRQKAAEDQAQGYTFAGTASKVGLDQMKDYGGHYWDTLVEDPYQSQMYEWGRDYEALEKWIQMGTTGIPLY
jgi:hypothetical protein